jgi:hypothetical protein
MPSARRIRRETTLKNGDILSFGYVKLRGGDSRSRLFA